ncbi:hypothetical protein AV530_012348 [Patagioenas fasciata monilis]|uniref:Uncharacterized protein n=1 Tax=Patagioenas fasciata monilis TaxID=372326 RepID=A0A1V4JAP8_PATFA|nr:hypothetical protein AV530_012348 [Patagioenas fasciata monilis]
MVHGEQGRAAGGQPCCPCCPVPERASGNQHGKVFTTLFMPRKCQLMRLKLASDPTEAPCCGFLRISVELRQATSELHLKLPQSPCPSPALGCCRD